MVLSILLAYTQTFLRGWYKALPGRGLSAFSGSVHNGTLDKNVGIEEWQIRFSSPLVKLFIKQPLSPLELRKKEIPRTTFEGTVVEVIITHFATFSSDVKT